MLIKDKEALNPITPLSDYFVKVYAANNILLSCASHT